MSNIFKSFPNIEDIYKYAPQPECVLFDMDGTIFDSEPIHAKAFIQDEDLYIKDVNDQYFIDIYGLADYEVFEYLQENNYLKPEVSIEKFISSKEKAFENFVVNKEVYLASEILELINKLKELDIRIGLVTSSERAQTDLILKHYNIDSLFEIIITREDTTKHKPHPAPYLHALEILEISNYQNIVILEDSKHGIESAKQVTKNVIEAKWYEK